MLNPSWLHTFKTLIDTGHFTQTADRLYMTQPGVSQHIKKLEQACGHSLINRDKKSFELTEQGRQVYDFALRLASNEAELFERLRFDDPYSGLCKISCSGALALQIYPKLLKLQARHKALITHLEAAPNDKILNDIQHGITYLGIVTQAPKSSQFHSENIGNEPLCLILPREYQDKQVTAESLKACGVVKHPDAKHYLSLYFDLCGDSELSKLNIDELPTATYVNQLSQILLPISVGIGFTVLPKSALDNFAHKEQLFIHRPCKMVNEPLFLVHKRNRQLAARYKTIREALFDDSNRKNKNSF